MPRLRTVTIGVVSTALAAGGLAVGAAASASAGASPHAAPASHGVTVTTRHTSLGTFLVDAKGHTLYLFEKDAGTNKSSCYRACAAEWPAFITHGKPVAAGKVKASKLGTTTRKNGSKQVTYNGDPLYHYAPDTGKSTRGEGVKAFGAEWYVINPKGHKIDED